MLGGKSRAWMGSSLTGSLAHWLPALSSPFSLVCPLPSTHLTRLSCFLFPAPSLSSFLSPVFLFSFLLWNSHQKPHGSKMTCAAHTSLWLLYFTPIPTPCPFSLEALWAGTIYSSECLVNHEPLGWSLGSALANMTADSDNVRNSNFTLLTCQKM